MLPTTLVRETYCTCPEGAYASVVNCGRWRQLAHGYYTDCLLALGRVEKACSQASILLISPIIVQPVNSNASSQWWYCPLVNPSSEAIYSEVSQSEVLVTSSSFGVGPSLIFAGKNCSHYPLAYKSSTEYIGWVCVVLEQRPAYVLLVTSS